MGTKMKGIYKGFNKYISQIFVVKEREIEMEIGHPTDVKHVAHIGWDGPSAGSAPSWMNGFKTGPDFASSSIGNSGSCLSPWSSQDFESVGQQSITSEAASFKDAASSFEVPAIPKKHKRRKNKSTSSPRSGGGSASSRSSRKSRSKFVEGDANQANIEVS
ncbi:hypothetical protein Leryth_024208 [Lithospermum erythrorhizon]|nr:hypothetical protein Leryth_024208 [Lithospermum erythrorhizon]